MGKTEAPMAEENIRLLWQHGLSESLKIESRLQLFSGKPSVHTRESSASSSLSGAQEKSSLDIHASPEDAQNEAMPDVELIEDATSSPTQYGCYLEEGDVEAAKIMVKEMIDHSLIPFMERNIQIWNEQVATSRRSFAGRLTGASRRLFGTSRTPSPHAMKTIPATGTNVPMGTNTLTM